jgi:hypothetical protein
MVIGTQDSTLGYLIYHRLESVVPPRTTNGELLFFFVDVVELQYLHISLSTYFAPLRLRGVNE